MVLRITGFAALLWDLGETFKTCNDFAARARGRFASAWHWEVVLLCRASCLLSVRSKATVFPVFLSLGVNGLEFSLDIPVIYWNEKQLLYFDSFSLCSVHVCGMSPSLLTGQFQCYWVTTEFYFQWGSGVITMNLHFSLNIVGANGRPSCLPCLLSPGKEAITIPSLCTA